MATAGKARSDASLPTAILLDASDSGLVLARSLRRRGVPIVSLVQPVYAWTARTRGVDRRIMPSLDDPEDWLGALDELGRGGKGVLIPLSDRAVQLLCRERDRIPPALRSFEHSGSAHLKLMDKASLYAVAADVGVRVPHSEVVADHAGLDEAVARARFPCLVKPALSHEYRRLIGERRVTVVEDEAQLRAATMPALDFGLAMLVAEHVPGPETNLGGAVTVRLQDGSVTLAYTRRKLRQFPPFGAGSVLEAWPAPDAMAIARRLLDAVGFVGVSSLEAKRHEVTGEHVLMEINVRVPMNIGLGEACGVDAAWRIYATLAGLPLGPQPEQRNRTKTIVASLEAPAIASYVPAGELPLRELARSYRGVRVVSGLHLGDPAPLLAFAAPKVRRGMLAARDVVRERAASARARDGQAPGSTPRSP